MDNPEDFETLEAMRQYGGGFVKQLSELCNIADRINLRKIKDTWPEYWKQYSGMAKQIKANAGK